jgi:hypothetical protein
MIKFILKILFKLGFLKSRIEIDRYKNKSWYIYGRIRHRENGPAIEDANGHKSWWLNGKIHREDGPAIIYADGTKFWFLYGKIHREDGPAVEYENGTKAWCLKGKRHREDGPAVEYNDGTKAWFLNDRMYTYKEWFYKLTPEQQYNYLWNLDE